MATPTTAGAVSPVALSGNAFIDSLIKGMKWGGSQAGVAANVMASFPDLHSAWTSPYGDLEHPFAEPAGIAPLTAVQQQAALRAMTAWAAVANVQWQIVGETTSLVGDVRIAFSTAVAPDSNNQAWGYTYYPDSSNPDGGDIWIDFANRDSAFATGSFDFTGLLHELGHALGLMHPFEGPNPLPLLYQNWQYSIMAYRVPPNWGGVMPSTPMVMDILAMQYLYGANTSYHSGDDVYRFDPAHPLVETIWDAGGINTIDVSAFNTAVQINLIDGSYSSIGLQQNIGIAFNTQIQNVVGGAGNNTIIGNGLNNQIIGGSACDMLYGLAGDDAITVGQGKSWIDGGVGGNTVVFGSSLASYQFVRDGDSLRVLGSNNSRAILTDVQTLSFSDKTVAVANLATHAAVSSGSVRTGIVELYVAMVGRAPELDGFTFWEGAALDGRSTLDLANIMFSLPIVQALYPESADQTSFINSIYQFVLGRSADSEGLAFWQSQLSNGLETRGGLIVDLVNVALNTADGTPGKAFLVNRVAAAQATLELQQASANNLSVETINEVFSGINGDTTTVSTALLKLRDEVSNSYNELGTTVVTATGILFEHQPIEWVG